MKKYSFKTLLCYLFNLKEDIKPLPKRELTILECMNKWFEPIEDLVNQLNLEKLKFVQKELGNLYDIKNISLKGDNIFSVVTGSSSAVSLAEPAKIVTTLSPSKLVMLRVQLSYEQAARWTNSQKIFQQNMGIVVADAIEKFEQKIRQEFGTKDKYQGEVYISCRISGRSKQEGYFLELSECSGYELRFYCDLAVESK